MPQELHTFLPGVFVLVVERRHLLRAAPVDHMHFLRAEPCGGICCVDRGISCADDSYAFGRRGDLSALIVLR